MLLRFKVHPPHTFIYHLYQSRFHRTMNPNSFQNQKLWIRRSRLTLNPSIQISVSSCLILIQYIIYLPSLSYNLHKKYTCTYIRVHMCTCKCVLRRKVLFPFPPKVKTIVEARIYSLERRYKLKFLKNIPRQGSVSRLQNLLREERRCKK